LGIGADEHIDYHMQSFEEVVSDLDFVFDMFNGEVLLNSVKVVKQGGAIISLPTPNFSDETLNSVKEKDVDLSFLMVQSNGDDVNKLKGLLESGAIKPYISKTFAFDKMGDANLGLESVRTVGKIVVKV
jgi:NADPH:quinone reductase-like Zn-dependent oxidoreductase